MTTELTKAAQQDITERLRKDKWHITGVDAEEAAQLIEELREQLAKAKADERHIYEAYSRCADERSALTQRPAAQTERAAFEEWFDDYYDKACAEFGGIDCTDPKGIAEDAWQARASLPTQPAAQATPEPVTLGPLAKRNIYDAIRGAYDLGYNDARNARTVPGDSAPGYDGRSVEEDHGGALFNLLSRRLKPATQTQQAAGEPVGEVYGWAVTGLSFIWRGEHAQACAEQEAKTCGGTSTAFPLFTRPAPGVPEDVLSVCAKVADSPEVEEALCHYIKEESDTHTIAWLVEVILKQALAAAQAKGAGHE